MSRKATAFAIICFAAITGCAPEEQPAESRAAGPEINAAVAVLHPTEGNAAAGVVRFTKVADGVRIDAQLSGLSLGDHGFHIHQYGDCTAANGTSAGGHFNPEETAHAGPDASQRHVGDLGNITADADGNASMSRIDRVLQLNGPHSIIGRGLIVHADADDMTSQPTGAAGGRVACGVIGVAK